MDRKHQEPEADRYWLEEAASIPAIPAPSGRTIVFRRYAGIQKTSVQRESTALELIKKAMQLLEEAKREVEKPARPVWISINNHPEGIPQWWESSAARTVWESGR